MVGPSEHGNKPQMSHKRLDERLLASQEVHCFMESFR